MLLRQFFIRILLDQNRLLKIVYDLQDENELIVAAQFHCLQIAANYLGASCVEVCHLELRLFVDAFPDEEEVGLYRVCLFLYCCLELLERVLGA